MNFEALIEHLVPSLTHARASADALRAKHPDLTARELSDRVIHTAKLKAATSGAVTGAASSPLTMIPAALADMAAVLAIEGAMVAEIGALLSPDSLSDPAALKADVISIIFPAAASQALRQFGIRAGERLTQSVMRKYASEDFVRSISRYGARFISKQLTRETVLTKAVPLVGIGIGAGWNWLEVSAIGARAIRYYSDEPLAAPPANGLPSTGKLWGKVRRYLPGKPKE
jgi:hypothetical protein